MRGSSLRDSIVPFITLFAVAVLASFLAFYPAPKALSQEEFHCDDVRLDFTDSSMEPAHIRPPGSTFSLALTIHNDSPAALEQVHWTIRWPTESNALALHEARFAVTFATDEGESETSEEIDLSDLRKERLSSQEWINFSSKISPGRTYALLTDWLVHENSRRGEWIRIDVHLEADVAQKDSQYDRISCTLWQHILIMPNPATNPKLAVRPSVSIDDDTPAPGERLTVTTTFRNPGSVFQEDIVAHFFQDIGGGEPWLEIIPGTTTEKYAEYGPSHRYEFGPMPFGGETTLAIGEPFKINEMNPGMIVTFRFEAMVLPEVEIGRLIAPRLCVDSYVGLKDPHLVTWCAEEQVTVVDPSRAPELHIAFDLTPRLVARDGPVLATITVRNNSDEVLEGAILRIRLPRALDVVPNSGSLNHASFIGPNGAWVPDAWIADGVTMPKLPPKSKADFIFQLVPGPNAVYDSDIRLSATLYSDTSELASDEAAIVLERQVEITAEIAATSAVAERGTVAYAITIRNVGQMVVENTLLSVELANGLTYGNDGRVYRPDGYRDAMPEDWMLGSYVLPRLEEGSRYTLDDQVRIEFSAILDDGLEVGDVLTTSIVVFSMAREPFVTVDAQARATVVSDVDAVTGEELESAIDDVSPFNEWSKAMEWLGLELVTMIGTLLLGVLAGWMIFANREPYRDRLRHVWRQTMRMMLEKAGIFPRFSIAVACVCLLGARFWGASGIVWLSILGLTGLWVVASIWFAWKVVRVFEPLPEELGDTERGGAQERMAKR